MLACYLLEEDRQETRIRIYCMRVYFQKKNRNEKYIPASYKHIVNNTF